MQIGKRGQFRPTGGHPEFTPTRPDLENPDIFRRSTFVLKRKGLDRFFGLRRCDLFQKNPKERLTKIAGPESPTRLNNPRINRLTFHLRLRRKIARISAQFGNTFLRPGHRLDRFAHPIQQFLNQKFIFIRRHRTGRIQHVPAGPQGVHRRNRERQLPLREHLALPGRPLIPPLRLT